VFEKIYFSCATFIKTIASLITKLKTFLLLSTKTPQTSGVFVFLDKLIIEIHCDYCPVCLLELKIIYVERKKSSQCNFTKSVDVYFMLILLFKDTKHCFRAVFFYVYSFTLFFFDWCNFYK